MPVTESNLSPQLLVAYVSAAAAEIVDTGGDNLDWAMLEAVDQLEAEQVRLNDSFASALPPRVAALSRGLGPVLELSDLVLRAASGTVDIPTGSGAKPSPAEERTHRMAALARIVDALKAAREGDRDKAIVVRDIFARSTDLVVGRLGQPELL